MSEQISVKIEPEWVDEVNKEDNAALGNLYAGHDIKPDLVLGPEAVQMPDVMIKVEIESEPAEWSGEVPTPTEQPIIHQHLKTETEGWEQKTYPIEYIKDEKVVTCTICNKEIDRENMQKHMRHHNKVKTDVDSYADENEDRKEANFPCNKCERTFTKKKSLAMHLRGHKNDQFYCKTCPKGSKYTCNNIGHDRISLRIRATYPCELCDKKYNLRWRLNEHMKFHKKTHRCNICDKAFARTYNYNVHMRTHTDIKPYSCEICHKSFREKGNLTGHLLTHTQNKPFICEICNRGFKVRSNLNNHLQTHKEKTVSCDICKRTFVCKRYLFDHLKTHLGEKSFACDVCNKSFLFKWRLVKHYQIHTGEKPYYCNICGRGYTKKDLLISHIQRHDIVICKPSIKIKKQE